MSILFKSKPLTLILLAIYLISLFWIIVLKFNISAYHDGVERSMNWIPFPSLFGLSGQGDLNESLLNIFIFIPFGLYVGILGENWPIGQKLILFFVTSFIFEISQYLFKYGDFDATDLVNNTAGGVVGFLIFAGLEKRLGENKRALHIINLLGLVGTVLVLSFLFYLKLNHLWIFRMELIQR